jgi:hypothetical protein
MKYLLILLSTGLLTSCDILLDQALDCIDDDRPVFDLSVLPQAILNQEYDTTVTASIKREANDDWYNYAFKIEGDLPHGILMSSDRGSRYALFSGTPTELGEFGFLLKVIVTEPDSYFDYEQSDSFYDYDQSGQFDDGDDLCHNRFERRYSIQVVQSDESLR